MRTFREFQDTQIEPHPAYARHPSVSTVGLITAHNPMGVRQSDRLNFDANGKLLEDIRRLGCKATVVHGMYAGHREETYLLVNVRRQDLMRVARRHRQDAIIWGFRSMDDNGHQLHMYYLDNGVVQADKMLEVRPEDLDTPEAFFEAIKSGKVNLPNFTPRRSAVAVVPKEDLGDYQYGTD